MPYDRGAYVYILDDTVCMIMTLLSNKTLSLSLDSVKVTLHRLRTNSSITYNIYYGYLHSHTGVSDGSGTPSDAYSQAKNAGLDFFGTTDHDYWPQDMSTKNWDKINKAADSFNEDGVFTALVGYEWTSDEADVGHELGRNHGKRTASSNISLHRVLNSPERVAITSVLTN